ncbi:AMIN-like domain-containing (lipo)protein [Rhodococcoides fascians]|uniref:AMIN-like domain-containing (lipo)protein n=1 Tax=Rhodococcoides fascians TaxID=1828 RepID=UPI001F4C5969|nr:MULTISPECIES: hypothetical protein [Rhodococcus]
MRAGVALLAAASLFLASCSSNEVQSETESTTEVTAADLRLVSGSFTVGSPVLETPPPFHGLPSDSTPTAPGDEDGDFGIADVQVVDARAVFTFAGEGVINYVGRYVDSAATYAGGDLDVPGTSILQVDLISSPSADPGNDVEVAADGGIRSLLTSSATAGVVQAFVGTGSERPDFTVTTESDPPTLIVTVLG